MSRTQLLSFKSQSHLLKAVWPQTSYLTPLCRSCVTCAMAGVITARPYGLVGMIKGGNIVKPLKILCCPLSLLMWCCLITTVWDKVNRESCRSSEKYNHTACLLLNVMIKWESKFAAKNLESSSRSISVKEDRPLAYWRQSMDVVPFLLLLFMLEWYGFCQLLPLIWMLPPPLTWEPGGAGDQAPAQAS